MNPLAPHPDTNRKTISSATTRRASRVFPERKLRLPRIASLLAILCLALHASAADAPLRIVMLGDSITRGVRTGEIGRAHV